MSMMLLIAGHETTVNLIANGLLALLTHPEQLARLKAEPQLVAGAVEEFLRWDSPVHSTPVRFVAEDVEYAGATIPAGAVVVLSLAAANRDGDRFADAEELRRRPGRPAATSPSGTACTTASARSWPASRARRASACSWPGARTWPWRSTPPTSPTGGAR